jgi:hypothetical protein
MRETPRIPKVAWSDEDQLEGSSTRRVLKLIKSRTPQSGASSVRSCLELAHSNQLKAQISVFFPIVTYFLFLSKF